MSLDSKIMIIMRGLPGSGKSTIAKILELGLVNASFNPSIKSTDSKFESSGNYEFDKTKLTEYHEQNKSEAMMVCEEGRPVIINNTNITPDEFNAYIRLGEGEKYQIHIITVHASVEDAYRRTQNPNRTKGKVIPLEVIRNMNNKMEIGDKYLEELKNAEKTSEELPGLLPKYIDGNKA